MLSRSLVGIFIVEQLLNKMCNSVINFYLRNGLVDNLVSVLDSLTFKDISNVNKTWSA